MGGEGRRVGEDWWERAGSPTPSRLAPLHSVQPTPPHSTPPRLLRVVPHQPCCSACVRKMATGVGEEGRPWWRTG